MSADDSFIVLEETPSMLQFSLLNTPGHHPSSLLNTSILDTGTITKGIDTENSSNVLSDAASKFNDEIKESIVDLSSTLSTKSQSVNNINADVDDQQRKQKPPKTTLAQSFLLGDINCDKMKSYLPSLSNSIQKEDVEKWQHLIQERNDLKDALQRTNTAMRQQYSMVNNWQNSVKDLKENHETELNKFRNINDELFHQNYDLQAKVAELQHLAELSRKTCIQTEKNLLITDKFEKEELEKQIQSLKLELANTIATNVEIEEAHQETKVKLVAIQELFKNSTAEIANLKKKNECLQRDLDETKALASQYCENMNMIQTQCDVFRNDFELERKQREEMACERDQMIADIKMLKKRNQALVDEAQSYYTETSASLTSNVSIEDNNEIQTFVCPLCSNAYTQLNDLESHVQSCLEKN
ncbi:NF-kappa-B essential modulator isoform X2 [Sitodiplosis mosellana]|nr:NF-kappa-B essential modulator isoform X2 [Sitodiplosis mosellana]XP_055307840.1 NF-kappa-B essential modulator isoform X2 [Sitodiplosis mosellana]XP_055307841.1 NF-kappa-B essential modulator isoform X2 [Sitodiplosis mosellana]XP_055307842.1 NF-kappa-B essential modulator isoform X2 [Sitodiplosis mosellana]